MNYETRNQNSKQEKRRGCNPIGWLARSLLRGQEESSELADLQEALIAAEALRDHPAVKFEIVGDEIVNHNPINDGYARLEKWTIESESLGRGQTLHRVPSSDEQQKYRAFVASLIGTMVSVHWQGVVLGAMSPETVFVSDGHLPKWRFLVTQSIRSVGGSIPLYSHGVSVYHPRHDNLNGLNQVTTGVDWWQIQQLLLQLMGADPQYPLLQLNDEDDERLTLLACSQARLVAGMLGFSPDKSNHADAIRHWEATFAKGWNAEATDKDWIKIADLLRRPQGRSPNGTAKFITFPSQPTTSA